MSTASKLEVIRMALDECHATQREGASLWARQTYGIHGPRIYREIESVVLEVAADVIRRCDALIGAESARIAPFIEQVRTIRAGIARHSGGMTYAKNVMDAAKTLETIEAALAAKS